MIKTKNLLILTMALVILLVIGFWQKTSHQNLTNRSTTTTIIPGTLSKDELGRLTLGYGGDEEAVILLATPEGWILETSWNAKANEPKIDNLLNNLSDLVGEYRSNSAEVLADYGFVPEGAVRIKAHDRSGGEVFDLEVGNKPEAGMGNFVRLPDQNSVYLVTKGILGQLGLYGGPGTPQAKHFLDLQAVQENRVDIDRIVLTDGGQVRELAKEFNLMTPTEADTTAAEPTLDRNSWEWQLVLPRQTALVKTKADAVLGAVVNVRATDVVDPGVPPEDYGLADPQRTATMIREDGSQLVLEFGAQRPAEDDLTAGTFMRVRGEATVWIVTDYTVNNIFKPTEDLLPE